MSKYRPSTPIVAMIFAILGLGIYGFKAWYFPTRETWLLAIPLSIVGVSFAIWLYPRMEHLYATRARKINARVCTLIFIPLILSAAFGIGAPAVVLRIQGPDTQIHATVIEKTERFKRCRKQVYLAEYLRRLCVSGREFERLREGQSVLLHARVGVFGTLVFAIEPS